MSASVGILAMGSAVPDQQITNDELATRIDTSDEWIQSRTGIKTRHVVNATQSCSDLAAQAAQAALDKAGLSAEDLDLIIVATATADYDGFPSVAAKVQDLISAPHIPAFDLSAACTGFVYALSVADAMLKQGPYKHAMVIGAEVLSRRTNWADRRTCVLFGDGAAAALLGPVTEGYGCLSHHLYSDGSHQDILSIEAGDEPRLDWSGEHDARSYIHMDGQAVFKLAVSVLLPTIKRHLEDAGLQVSDIKYFCFHQANYRIIKWVQDKLGIQDEQVPMNLDQYGNTSAATIPLLMADLDSEGKLSEGDYILCIGFGAGFTWGSSLIRWKEGD